MNKIFVLCLVLLIPPALFAHGDTTEHPLIYINTNFENASQLDWEVDANGVVQVSLIYDHERSSPNRANGHWHFQMQAEAGSDGGGNLHVNLPTATNSAYTENLKRFEKLLFKHTWFREGASHVKNHGSFGEGMHARFGIDACVYELNYEWAKGLNKEPLGKDWESLGKQLRDVFFEYFAETR